MRQVLSRGPSGQTTVPARSTGGPASEASTLAIHWIFPTTRCPLTALATQSVSLGRAEDSDFVLQGTEASRHHAEVRREGPIHILRDLGSTNGVFINGQRITQAPLARGNLVRLGDWIGLIVEIQAAEARCESPVRSIAPKFFGGSALATAVEPVQRAARSDLPIIMQGETGTGKECLARAVHSWSKRSGSFLAVNCAALPESLAEGELFGYRKGAFTGADRAHPGYFRAAQNGTLLLDEVSDLPLSLQGKLLRVLEQREVLPLGESRPIEVDVRIIAAAQEPLSQAVAERRFRGDLYARLCGLEVQLPPLRDRIEDVPGLFARFLHERSGGQPPRVEPRLVEQLCLYDWPFNVRELELLSRRLLALHGHEPALRRSLLPKQFLEGGPVEDAGRPRARTSSEPPAETSDAMEAQVEGQSRDERDLLRLVAALRRSKGNVARAAAEAGISRQRAYRLMQGHAGIELDAFRQAPRAPGS